MLLYWQLILYMYQINILAPRTFVMFSSFWNGGGVLKGSDLVMFFILFSFIPICGVGWYYLYQYKYMKLILVPLSALSNMGLGKYKNGMPDVNLKNLKIEEKKTIEQLVQERLEIENKKIKKVEGNEFRKEIIEKIEKKSD